MEILLNMLPRELGALPVVVAGFLALLGLILWSAGVKAARPLVAAVLGAVLAGVGMMLLPKVTGLGEVTCALIGVAVGVFIGAVAFRALQGVILAACLGMAAAGGFYQWQVMHGAVVKSAGAASAQANIQVSAGVEAGVAQVGGNADMQAMARDAVQTGVMKWTEMPASLRQSLVIIAVGVAIVGLVVAWVVPRVTTWVLTAVLGTGMLVMGGMVVVRAFVPGWEKWVPASGVEKVAVVGAMVVVGLVVQRVYFWPGRRVAKERAEVAAG